jgi:PRC-barrel domain
MRIGPGTAAVIAISLIAASGVYGDSADTGQADPSAQPAQPRRFAQTAEPSSPPGPSVQQSVPSAVPSAPTPAPSASSPSGTPAIVFDDQEVSGILGKGVRSSADEDMGRIVDVIVNRDGQVRAAIIDFGGFLGVGNRKIAVDWRALNFAPAGKPGGITLELTRNQVRVAPEYKRGEPVVVLGPARGERAMPSSGAATPEK